MKRIAMAMAGMAVAWALTPAFAGEPIVPKEKTMLWDGKDFAGWTMFLGDPNVDPKTVWSIEDGAILCKGNPKGYLRTDSDYANYHLHVEWKWVDKGGNSGVLVHMSEPDKVWPKCIECQLMSGNAGDFWVIDTEFKEHADLVKKFEEEQAQATPAPTPAASDKAKKKGKDKAKPKGPGRRTPKMGPSSEKPLGEWNSYDIVCKGDTIEVSVNGVLQNKATQVNVQSGKILLQSEGTPIEFRNVYIEPVK